MTLISSTRHSTKISRNNLSDDDRFPGRLVHLIHLKWLLDRLQRILFIAKLFMFNGVRLRFA